MPSTYYPAILDSFDEIVTVHVEIEVDGADNVYYQFGAYRSHAIFVGSGLGNFNASIVAHGSFDQICTAPDTIKNYTYPAASYADSHFKDRHETSSVSIDDIRAYGEYNTDLPYIGYFNIWPVSVRDNDQYTDPYYLTFTLGFDANQASYESEINLHPSVQNGYHKDPYTSNSIIEKQTKYSIHISENAQIMDNNTPDGELAHDYYEALIVNEDNNEN